MDVVSDGPLLVGSVLWQTEARQWSLTVVARATFVLTPGESPLAAEQDALHEGDCYWNDDERCSLRLADDLVPFKRRADVLLVGNAYAPHDEPVHSLLARMAVGSVDKTVEVFSDRIFALDDSLLDHGRFAVMPLYWEHAAGGPETANPVGRRLDVADERGMTPLPNLQPPGLHVTSRLDSIPPTGFGPIAPWWPLRQAKLHRGLSQWDFRHWKRGPLPSDLDPAFFNAAPADQQVDAIRPDERIVLENLHPEHARLATNLVPATPRALVELPGGARQEFGMRCDTLTIDTTRGTCALTWRGQIPLDHPDAAGRVLVTTARPDARQRAAMHTLPASAGPAMGLPFAPAGATRSPALGDMARTLGAPLRSATPDLPFVATPSPLASSAPPQPPSTSPSADDGAPALAPRVPFVSSATFPFAEGEKAPAQPAGEPQAPPPMVGPLATLERAGSRAPGGSAPIEAAEPLVTPAAAELVEIPLERCAAIAASIARREGEQARILEENELTAETWEALDRLWAERIREETERGRVGLLRAYDAAYVARLEEERGPITEEEHARLVVAAERSRADAAMKALDLPPAAFMRIRRMWIARSATSATLGAKVRRAIELERER